MKKIYLFKVKQHGSTRYLGVTSAKDLVRLATKAEFQTVQEAQRPIKQKRVESIANFVNDEAGTLSTSIVIGTKDDRLSVHKVNDSNVDNLYYMDFPETEEEFSEYIDSFDIMDGQHRLFSFLDEFRKISDTEFFELSFEMYVKPTMMEKRMIFKNTNEKQEKVDNNLLMWFRKSLGMLQGSEKEYYNLVSMLNSETISPLKGKIIMSGEKITGGIKAQQVIEIINKIDIRNIHSDPLDDTKLLKLISSYLSGWENAVGLKISKKDKICKSFSKTAGLRFMLTMLPAFYNKALIEKQKFTDSYVSDLLTKLFATYAMVPSDIFNSNSDYIKKLGINPFGGRTPTENLAKDWSIKLKSLSQTKFDPLG